MRRVDGGRVLPLALSVVLLSCATPQGLGPSPGAVPGQPQRPAAPKRIVAAIQGNVHNFVARIDPTGIGTPGLDALEELLNTGLATHDNEGRLRPRLAEAAPTVKNGHWVVFPDGRMETRWTIRENARWQDGAPVTAADFLFTARVDQDREIVAARNLAYESVESMDAPDRRTLVVRWKRPYIEADAFFSRSSGPPLPQHLLEGPFTEDKASFVQLPFWTHEFVGTGPYQVRDFTRGSHLVLQAFDGYVLGRPRIDEIELKLITDTNTLMANLLAGAAEVTLGRSLSLEQALQLGDQWKEGRADVAYHSWIMMYPQLLSPTPPVVGDVRFRRALLHAIDRQEMADTLNFGVASVAHAYLSPSEPEYQEVEGSIVRYEYDPARAARIIEGLGYARASDGAFRDAANRRLSVEVRVSARNPLSNKAILAVVDSWNQIGVAAEPHVIPTQRSDDREYVANFPAFHLYRQPNEVNSLKRYHGSQARTAERSFVGTNYNRYMNPEFDALIDRYFATVPRGERVQVLGQILHQMTDQVLLMGLFYDVEATLVSHRLANVTARYPGSTQAWNAHQWDTKS